MSVTNNKVTKAIKTDCCPNLNCPWSSGENAEDDEYGCGLFPPLTHRLGNEARHGWDVWTVQMLLDGASAIAHCADGCPVADCDVRAFDELIHFDGGEAWVTHLMGCAATLGPAGRTLLIRDESGDRPKWMLQTLPETDEEVQSYDGTLRCPPMTLEDVEAKLTQAFEFLQVPLPPHVVTDAKTLIEADPDVRLGLEFSPDGEIEVVVAPPTEEVSE